MRQIKELMKERLKWVLQKLLGFKNYLFIFSLFTIATLKWKRKEKDFFHFLKRIHSDGLIIDIGANIGIMTYYLSRRFPNSEVLAFEPIPCNVRALKRVIALTKRKNINVHEYALGMEEGEAEMVMPVEKSVKMQGLSYILHNTSSSTENGIKYRTAIKRLDSVIPESDEKVVAIKIDVENFEYFVLNGALETIRKDRPLIYCELWDNENRTQCVSLMEKENYSTHVVEGGALMPYDHLRHKTQNFFFLPSQN